MQEDLYKRAIKQGRTIDFLLGREEYLFPDREWGGLHTGYITFSYIEEYGKKHGEEKMLKQFKADIKKALQLNLDTNDFLTISGYIYIYMRHFYKEKSISIEWIPDEETKMLIKKNYNSFLDQFDPSEKFDSHFPKQSNGFFLDNIISKYKFIKERFGIDLLA
jgi:hypothetical protein